MLTFEKLFPIASSYGAEIDALIAWIGIIVGFWFLLTEGVFLYFILKFRAKDGRRAQYITGEERSQKRWISMPHLLVLICDVFIVYGAVRIWVDVKQDLPDNPDARVRIIAQQWAWSFVHPGPDNALDTADDIKTVDEMHLEVDKTYVYELHARDVLHSFSIPAFRLKQDAVPGRVIQGWFKPTRTGTYDLQCAEICGIGHGVMAARVVIQTPAEHAAWMGKPAVLQLAAR